MSSKKQKVNATKKKVPQRGNGSSLVAFQSFLKSNKNPNVGFEPGITPLTMEEVQKHKSPNDCWTVYRGCVYNITPFLEFHPGGSEELLRGAGQDCTELYNKYHAWVNADAVMGKLRLGLLQKQSADLAPTGKMDECEKSSSETLDRGSKADRFPSDTTDLSLPTVAPRTPSCSYTQTQQFGVFHAFASVCNPLFKGITRP